MAPLTSLFEGPLRIEDGLFRGQSSQFMQLITSLARAADAADREVGD